MANRRQRRSAARSAAKLAVNPERVEYSDGKGKVMIAVPTGGNPEPQFMRCMLFLEAHDAKNNGHVIYGGSYIQKEGTNVSHSRNQLVKTFLEGGWEWLWFVDDDMTFEPDILDQLLESADPEDRPIVGALCFARLRGEHQEVVATIYGIQDIDGVPKMVRSTGYPRDQLVQVAATGSGCLLIHRSVFVELAKRWQTPWPWFDYSEWGHGTGWGKIPGTDESYAGPGDHIGEDITFCLRAGSEHGNRPDYDDSGKKFPIFVDTRIKCGHIKKFVVDETEYALRHPMVRQLAPNFAVIPVKGQHHYTEALLRQLGDQREHAGILVYDNGADTDPYEGFVPDNCEIIPAPGLTIHQMWNAGIRKARENYAAVNIAILNNDLEIGPEFLSGLAAALRSSDALFAVSPNYDGRVFEHDIQAVKGIAAGREDGTGGMAGFAFMVKGELYDHGFPLFDEQFELWYGDNDFVMTVEAMGGLIGIVRDTTVVHIDGGSKTAGDGTTRLKSDELQKMADRDLRRFEEKWQVRTVPV